MALQPDCPLNIRDENGRPLNDTGNYHDPFREGVVAVGECVLVDHAVRRIRLANSLDRFAVSRTGADSTAVDVMT